MSGDKQGAILPPRSALQILLIDYITYAIADVSRTRARTEIRERSYVILDRNTRQVTANRNKLANKKRKHDLERVRNETQIKVDIYKFRHAQSSSPSLSMTNWLYCSLDWDANSALVLEATVLVLAEERQADGGQSVGLEELKALFEGVVDLDLASAVEDDDAAGSVEGV